MTVYVIIADDIVDIVQDACPELDEHVKELRDMGCTVKRHAFPTWEDAEQFEDEYRAAH